MYSARMIVKIALLLFLCTVSIFGKTTYYTDPDTYSGEPVVLNKGDLGFAPKPPGHYDGVSGYALPRDATPIEESAHDGVSHGDYY